MTPLTGSLVAGRYRIEGELGHGGMGAVYRAVHVELGRPVALKMVLPDVIGLDQGLARFRREAELAQKLEHPNTVRLYDYGQTEAGLPYIAFELLRGMPLDRAIGAGGMQPARVVRIITQVLKSLMEAHGQGIIHRDIKPANVFLCEFSGEQDFVKVLDFGIAKSSQSRTVLTQAGHSLGTPNYMAPEQVRAETLTPAADLYSVGLMMAEMLTGRIVFSGTPTDVVTEHLSPRPVPLAASLARSPLLPILVRATEKDVARRYGTAAEMLRELEALARSGVLEAASTPFASFREADPMSEAKTVLAETPRPPARPSSKMPLVIVGALVLLLAASGAIALAMQGDGHPASPPIAAKDDDDAPKKKKKKPKADNDDDKPDVKSIKSRFEKLGWKIVSESTSKQPNMTVSTYSGQKGTQYATAYVYDTTDEAVAKSIEGSLTAKGSATKRVGMRLYWVLTTPADETLAEDIVSELAR